MSESNKSDGNVTESNATAAKTTSQSKKKERRQKAKNQSGAENAIAATEHEENVQTDESTASGELAAPSGATELIDEAKMKSFLDEINKYKAQMPLLRDPAKTPHEAMLKPFKFWSTQPVPKFDEVVEKNEAIEPNKSIADIRAEPYALPDGFKWEAMKLDDPLVLTELYTLLNENYVEDDDAMFRFDYQPEFLKWALQPPGWRQDWHVGVRVVKSGLLVGFISAIPGHIRIYDKEEKIVEINFLCVHKKLRSKRVAPVLIREITRRVNLTGIFQAVYTAGVVLPKPIATCRYWHRSLNPKKSIQVYQILEFVAKNQSGAENAIAATEHEENVQTDESTASGELAAPSGATELIDEAKMKSFLDEINKYKAQMPLLRDPAKTPNEAMLKPFKFWSTQPVPKFDEVVEKNEAIEPNKSIADIRAEPYALPDGFKWEAMKLDDPLVLTELYTLLNENYVEDDDAMFRFDYQPEFLKWALQPSGWRQDWHVGVRVVKSGLLVGFISAIPGHIRIYDKEEKIVEINFLCVHKKLRSKRVAPVLIPEITRRVNLTGIFQAVYTAGVVLPKPIATCRYWHRSLNPKKLIQIKFSSLSRNMTMQRTIKLYKLPEQPVTPGFRQMTKKDVPAAHKLLQDYLRSYKLMPMFSEDEFKHWFLPKNGIISDGDKNLII